MDGLIAPLRFILKIFNKGDSANNRNIQTRDIKDNVGPITIDQSNNQTINVNPISETGERKKRQDAADGVWEAFLEMKKNAITAVFLMDLAHPDNDLSKLGGNPYFAAALAELKRCDITEYLEPIANAETHRPYVSERLWNLLDAYKILLLRPALLLKENFPANIPANKWWEDVIIKSTITRDDMPKELEQLAHSDAFPLELSKRVIEREIMLEVQGHSTRTEPDPPH